MKKQLLTTMVAASLTACIFAQPTLTYEKHRLLPGQDNPMTICEYMEPGNAGENVTWDFSNLKAIKKFTGTIVEAGAIQKLEQANTKLVEFGTNFLFDIDENGIRQVGYASSDLKTVIEYNNQFEKLRFPFNFGDNYLTNFSGNYYYDSKKIGDVTGNGSVEADAFGTLKLPNNKVYANTIRIKTTKNYEVHYSNSKSDVEITTYRWYTEDNRYPALVLTSFTSGNGSSVNYQAAYNNKAVESSAVEETIANNSITAYPNPALDELYLNVNSVVSGAAFISVFDLAGKLIVEENEKAIQVGENTLNVSDIVSTLQSGNYLFNIRINNERIVKEIAVGTK